MAIITISRGTFSGGNALAAQLANRLGYPSLGREEAIQEATKEYGISMEKLTSAVKNPPSIWQQAIGPRIAYLKCLTASILEHAKDGNLVYHGYAGHMLLVGISRLLRVRVIADKEFRIQAAMKQMNFKRIEAIDYIEKVDKERSRWTYFLYGLEWQDPALYDLVLNLERMTIEDACEVIACRINLADFKATPESQKTFDDSLLSSRVWASLARNERTRIASIQVTADSGTVILKGSLGSQKTLDNILQIAKQVKGVKSVINEMGIGTDWYW
jgi:osmotically-inducible protein OsmY